MIVRNTIRYIRALPTVIGKLKVLHQHSLLLDEASPQQLNKSLRAWRIIKREYGFLRSLTENQCVSADGNPIPWYTYAAIEQLSKWDFSDCDVLEYGCGNSTLWWAQRASSVVSIESSVVWYQRIVANMPTNNRLILSEVDPEDESQDQVKRYIDVVDELGMFDVIIVDGVNRPGVRFSCTQKAISHLKPGGILIVDNSDWLPTTCDSLRQQGFVEVDFSGLGPLNDVAETTSLFFKSDFRIRPVSEDHPGPATGGYPWNRELPN